MKEKRIISKRHLTQGWVSVFLVLALVIGQLIPAYAEENSVLKTEKDDLFDKAIETGTLETFVSSQLEEQMKTYQVPGAVVVIVKDGKIVFSKGYGYSNLEKKIPMSPNQTKLRIASITKLFTATAIMQLVEKDQIQLNKDVNAYLNGFQIKNPYAQKVTMDQLLTHTSGIDSDNLSDLSEKASNVKPIGEFLRNRMLPVVRQPGDWIQYSNYGVALAGCILENVSGMSCADYIDGHIFKPLKMTQSNFIMNQEGMAQGYVKNGNRIEPKHLKGYFNLYPIGGIVSTGEDMARFMIAQLNQGEYQGQRILKETTAKNMQQRHAVFDGILPGTCYGFAENEIGGNRIICHPGYAPDGFSSQLSLIPEKRTGVFVAVNQGSNNSIPQDFVQAFVKQYFQKSDNQNAEIRRIAPNPEIVGTYRFGEYTHSTIGKGDLFGAGDEVKVSIVGNQVALDIVDPFIGNQINVKAIQISPLVLRSETGEYYVFKKDKNDKINYMADTATSWHGTYERISDYETNTVQVIGFTICSVIFMLELLACMVVFIQNRGRVKKGEAIDLAVTRLIGLNGANALLNILFYGISMMTWGDRLRYGVPMDIKILLCLPIICTFLTALITTATVIAWIRKQGSLLMRVSASIAALASIWFIWLYQYLNMLGFRF